MSDKARAIASAKNALDIEIAALNKLASRIEVNIEPALNLITSSNGRVIISGIGKSGLVGAKIAATLSSTGTPAYFIHSTDALHGESGDILAADLAHQSRLGRKGRSRDKQRKQHNFFRSTWSDNLLQGYCYYGKLFGHFPVASNCCSIFSVSSV